MAKEINEKIPVTKVTAVVVKDVKNKDTRDEKTYYTVRVRSWGRGIIAKGKTVEVRPSYNIKHSEDNRRLTKKTAEELARKIVTESETGLDHKAGEQTANEFFNYYMKGERAKKAYATNSILEKEHYIYKNILPAIGHLPMKAIKPLHCQKLIDDLIEKGVATSSVQKTKRHMVEVFNRAMNLEMINRNPASLISVPRNEKKAPEVWTEEELNKFLKAAYGHRLFPIFYLMSQTGLRVSEAMGLPWDNVDLEAGTIFVNQQALRNQNFKITDRLKTASSRRIIKISDDLVTVLKEHKEAQEKELEKLKDKIKRGKKGIYLNENNLVAMGKTGRSPSKIAQNFQELIEKAKVKKIELGNLRHTFATIKLSKNVNLKALANIMGHKNERMIIETYGQYVKGTAEELMETHSHSSLEDINNTKEKAETI